MSVRNHPEVFVGGDQATFVEQLRPPYPAIAPVALQQGRFIAHTILRDMKQKKKGARLIVKRY